MLQQLLRNEQDTRALCGVVYDTYIVPSKPVERSDLRKSSNSGQQRSSATGGSRPRLGPPFYLGWSGSDPRAHHGRDAAGRHIGTASGSLGELNRLPIEDRCRMVKHCAVDKTFQPTQCRITLVVEVPSLRSMMGKSLEMLQGERKHRHESCNTRCFLG